MGMLDIIEEGFPDDTILKTGKKLWCGRIQGFCDGSICVDCHLFPESRRKHLKKGDSIRLIDID